MKPIHKNIKTLRKLRGVTQQKLADAIGVNRLTISAYEKGRATPPLEKLIALKKYFVITLDILCLSEMKLQITAQPN